MALNLFAIPPGVPFLDTLAAGWVRDRGPDPLTIAKGLILTPTRRSARALAEAFLRVSNGQSLLLPRIVALGALDETPLTLAGALDLPPAVDPHLRLSVLTGLILRMNGAGGAPKTADRAWLLAIELANLMDEADRTEIDLAARLPDAADPAFAAHWAKTLEFLHIVTHAWPGWLAENGVLNPAARQVALLNAQAAAWEACPPPDPVTIAGTTAGIPAVARLARVVARLPRGQVVLPVLDTEMSPKAWAAMEDSHPQAGLAALLAGLDATRDDARVWDAAASPVPSAASRFSTLSRALLPAAALATWQEPHPVSTAGLFRLRPRDPQEEAEAISLILRQAIETPGRTAALVTPDRDLAGRVSAILPRHGIVADDSAGEPLADTPPAVFLRLLAQAVEEQLAPVPLLALLKHPLAAAGQSPAACRAAARALEHAALRGPRPPPGIVGLRQGLEKAGEAANAFLARLESCLAPALRIKTAVVAPPVQSLSALIESAEALAATDTEAGDVRLWAEEEGEALATALTAALTALPGLPDQTFDIMPGLIDALLRGATVRTRRAIRGRDGIEHPRVFIWGPLEARLQSADVLILGGLAETVWPPAPEPGPWLSRPMRKTIGLPSPEEAVGAAAHDFLAAAMSAPEVVLSCPDRRDGAPTVPARWLTRLETMLKGRNLSLPAHPAVAWARGLDRPDGGAKPAGPPRPCPPVALRPSRLSVTEIETWLRDPYAIYAKHILKLRKLDDLDQETDAIDFGDIVHKGLEIFLRQHGTAWPEEADAQLRRAMAIALAESLRRPALTAWWEPRLDRIAAWVAVTERTRRTGRTLTALAPELPGLCDITRPGRRFRLTAKADRIERDADGHLTILDYKTGQVPAKKNVVTALAPQLPLEAAMALAGGFGDAFRAETAALTYWQLSGGFEPGKIVTLTGDKDTDLATIVRRAIEGLEKLIDQYDQPDRPYLSEPHPSMRPRFSDHAQLARVAERALAMDEEAEDGS